MMPMTSKTPTPHPKRRRLSAVSAAVLPFVFAVTMGNVFPADDADHPVDPKLLQEMKFRNIGPHRGGRVTAVAGVPGARDTFYMGSTGGGVWKTADGGVTWTPMSDKDFKSASMGAIAVAPSDVNVVYAGTGSACVRGNVSPGDGMYRSTDAGETWKGAGLEDAGQIGRIRVHPQDPDTVWVAVLGHAFGPSAQRGVFKSENGGDTWKKVLKVNDEVGAVDLALDPKNPRILFATTWRVQRKPWEMLSGGEGSGLWKSTDGGDTWTELTEGLPAGPLGRIGVAISGADGKRVWALVEAKDGGLYRSDDGGKTFKLVNSDRNIQQRAWYYMHVYADPVDTGTVWILNVGLWRSDDGGKTFNPVRAPHGDHHDLWINPDDPRVMINGNDGGANISYHGGKSWSTQANQPTAEMYRVTVNRAFPYRVYGCQQDNTCVSVPSRTPSSGITQAHWYVIGGCESGHVAVDPRNPLITYSGCYGGTIGRYDHATGQEREIMAWPQLAVGQAPRDLKYRFQWNAPIRLSPHDPTMLYHTSQHVHRSTDEGQSWSVISPDLTRNDPARQDFSGGPITRDNTGVEVYGTIFAFEESPKVAGLLWAGSDDGVVHLSRDAGETWENITPAKMPEWSQVNMIELSPHGGGRAFIAVTRYKLDDFRPFIYRTDNLGQSWELLTDGRNGIPADHPVRVVREDPDRRGLLYAGTEFGLYVSFDDGARWQSLQLNLPITPITDLAVTRQDLVVATQGRSFWILDDVTPLHEADRVAAGSVHLYRPRDTVRFGSGGGGPRSPAGENPPTGVIVQYTLPPQTDPKASKPAGATDAVRTAGASGTTGTTSSKDQPEVVLEILDAEGTLLRRLSSLKDEPHAVNPEARFMPPESQKPRRLPAKEGMNRYVWDFRLHDAEIAEGSILWGGVEGPRVPPGRYKAILKVGNVTQARDFMVQRDPRLELGDEDLVEQYRLSKEIHDSLSESHRAMKQIRDIRAQVDDLVRRVGLSGKGDGLAGMSDPMKQKLTTIEEALHQTKASSSQDILNFTPMLDNQLVALLGVVESADARPTDAARRRYEELRAELEGHLTQLSGVIRTDLAAFNDAIRGRDVAPVIVTPLAESQGAVRTASDEAEPERK